MEFKDALKSTTMREQSKDKKDRMTQAERMSKEALDRYTAGGTQQTVSFLGGTSHNFTQQSFYGGQQMVSFFFVCFMNLYYMFILIY